MASMYPTLAPGKDPCVNLTKSSAIIRALTAYTVIAALYRIAALYNQRNKPPVNRPVKIQGPIPVTTSSPAIIKPKRRNTMLNKPFLVFQDSVFSEINKTTKVINAADVIKLPKALI